MSEEMEAMDAAAAPRKTALVKYEVYRLGAGVLQVLTTAEGGTVVEASNDVEAIKAHNPSPGQYVAIPVRSLRVRKVEHINEPKVVIS